MTKLCGRKKKSSEQRHKNSQKRKKKGARDRKISYPSTKAAHTARRVLEELSGVTGLVVYPCQFCSKHHVGHKK